MLRLLFSLLLPFHHIVERIHKREAEFRVVEKVADEEHPDIQLRIAREFISALNVLEEIDEDEAHFDNEREDDLRNQIKLLHHEKFLSLFNDVILILNGQTHFNLVFHFL